MTPAHHDSATGWLERLRAMQDGVVSRSQLRQISLEPHDIARLVRRGWLRRVHPRVYVDHTGPLTWRQRAWAAVLFAEPAALCWHSQEEPATRDDGGPIHVAIDQSRRLQAPPGVVVHRMTDLRARVLGGHPPRLRREDNALSMAGAAATELDAVAALADAVGRGGVTSASLRDALDRFPRLHRRHLLTQVIDDLALGTASVLEHGYLTRVERAHRLPRSRRQAPRRTASGWEYRDVEYRDQALVVELDGRLGHGSWAAGARDADRDLDDLALGGMVSVRLRWRQVYGTTCRTAGRIALILQRRGWRGTPSPCGPGCDLAT